MARRLTRRAILMGGSGARRLVFRPAAGPVGDALVVVFLRGGMDALHTFPPLGDPAYRRHRPTLAVPEPGTKGGALELDSFFGLHPDLAPLAELFRAGRLAVIHACGSPDTTLSHFEAMQTMERGVSDGNRIASGWIARHLAAFDTGNDSPARALAFAEVLPKSMQGAAGALAITSLRDLRLAPPASWQPEYRALLARLYATGADPVRAAGRSALALQRALEKLDPERYRPAGGARYPETPFGRGLRQVAQLLRAEMGLEIAEVDLGGWDSHVAQATLLSGLMRELAEGLHAFAVDLADRAESVTLVAMSEFGRRAYENSGLGTDHGRGTAMLALGGGIRGGRVYGKWPGLDPERLDRDGNLVVTTDYRDVLAEVLARRVGNPNWGLVFPDYAPRFPGVAIGRGRPGATAAHPPRA